MPPRLKHEATFTAMAALGLALGFATVAGAEPPFSACPWATCYATKRTRPIKVDAELSEWKDIPGVTMAEEKFFFVGQGMSSAKWQGPQDLIVWKTSVKL